MKNNSVTHDSLEELVKTFLKFSQKRGWDKQYTPNQLAKALIIESAELLELFQRKDDKGSFKVAREKKTDVSYELVDVLYYTLMMAHICGIDLVEATKKKLKVLAKRYPANLR